MLKLSLTPGEYLTIGEDIVVQVYRSALISPSTHPGRSPLCGAPCGSGRVACAPRGWRRFPRRGTAPRIPFDFTRFRAG